MKNEASYWISMVIIGFILVIFWWFIAIGIFNYFTDDNYTQTVPDYENWKVDEDSPYQFGTYH